MSEWAQLWQQHTVKQPKATLVATVNHLAPWAGDAKRPALRDLELALDFLRWRYTPLGLHQTLPPGSASAQGVALRWIAQAPKATQQAFANDVLFNLAHPAWHQQLWPVVVGTFTLNELLAELGKRLGAKNELHALNALLLPYFVFARNPTYQPDRQQTQQLHEQARGWLSQGSQIVRRAAAEFMVPEPKGAPASSSGLGASSGAAAAPGDGKQREKLIELYVQLGGGARQVKSVRTGATSRPITRGADPKVSAEPFVDKILALGLAEEVLPVLERLGGLPEAMRALFMEGLFNAVDASEARDILGQAQAVLPKT